MAGKTYQLSTSSTLPIAIAIVAGVIALVVLVAHFSGRTWFAKSHRPYFGGRVGKWIGARDQLGDDWQLISYRTGSIPPVGAPSLLPGPLKLFGEGAGPIIDGLLVNRVVFRGGWTVTVGPRGSRPGNVVSRRCPDRTTADDLIDRLVTMIENGTWNADGQDMPA